MSVFTTVTPEQLQRWLKNYGVGTLVELKGIAAGIENTNYFVTTTADRYVLTLFEKLTAAELPFYLDLMAHLARAGIPAAAPVADRTGAYLGTLNGKPASLVARLSGKDIEHPTADDCAKVGDMLARIHLAGQSYPAKMDDPRGASWRASAMRDVLPFLDATRAAMLRDEVAAQAQHPADRLPQGVIHADLFRDNILFDRENITGVIDFYFACSGALLYDVAIAVNDWCLLPGYRLDSPRARALLDAYHRVRSFTAEERETWPMMLRAGALRFWLSRLFDLHLPRPGELTHAKDPSHFEKLLRLHLEHAADLPVLTP